LTVLSDRTILGAMCSAEEQAILDYLATNSKSFFSAREVCRRAGGKEKWDENQRWALPILARLLARGLIETDPAGHYRLPQGKG
jgi:hypothetical protein